MTAEPRHDLPIPLRVELVRPDGSRSTEYAVNLSAGGLCLQLREPMAVGESVRIAFALPPAGLRVEAEGRVVWTSPQEDPGGARHCEMGLRFEALEPEIQAALEAYAEQPREQRR